MSKNKEFLSKLTPEEKEMYKELTKEQRGHLIYMREDQAKEYMYRQHNKKVVTPINEVKDQMLRMIKETDGAHLSRRAQKEDLEKDCKCKYCGDRFRTQDAVDKHQRTCV